jgi:X8 domain
MPGIVEVRSGAVVPKPEYKALLNQLKAVQPLSVELSKYRPTNTPAPSCDAPTITISPSNLTATPVVIQFSANLPPVPNQRLCSCMMSSLACTANTTGTMQSLRAEDLTRICNKNRHYCAGIEANSTIGAYGAFSPCNKTERHSWAYNQFYGSQGMEAAACSSIGGTMQQSIPLDSQPKDCQIFLRQAGPDGTGSILYTPTPSPAPIGGSTTPAQDRPFLNAAAKIGLVVAAAAVLLFLVIGVIFYRLKRRGKANPHHEKDNDRARPELAGNLFVPSELEEKAKIDRYETVEMNGDQTRELQGQTLVELPGVDEKFSDKRDRGSKATVRSLSNSGHRYTTF